MTTQKHTRTRNHSEHFLKQLTANTRNSLRVVLSTKTGLSDLRHALGINHMQVLSDAEVALGHARRGTTVELFRKR